MCVFGVGEREEQTDNGGVDVISELHRTGQEVLLNMCSVVAQCASLPHRKRVVSLNLLLASSSSVRVGSHVAHEKVWPPWPLRWCSVGESVAVNGCLSVCGPRDGDSQSRVVTHLLLQGSWERPPPPETVETFWCMMFFSSPERYQNPQITIRTCESLTLRSVGWASLTITRKPRTAFDLPTTSFMLRALIMFLKSTNVYFAHLTDFRR